MNSFDRLRERQDPATAATLAMVSGRCGQSQAGQVPQGRRRGLDCGANAHERRARSAIALSGPSDENT
jgi:hypothetical protein